MGSNPNLNPDLLALLNERWRMTPARLAEHLSQGRFHRYAHIHYLDRILSQAIARGGSRLVISMPPRHGKSWLTSLYTPVWFLSLWPEKNIILTSYEAAFAATWGRQVRNFIQEHSQPLKIRLANDSLASDHWNTLQGGGMVTAGIGGPITGRGGSLLIIDDPVKNWEEATSEVQQKKTIDWFNSTLYTRAEPGASIIILMTRWHENDLAGHLLRENNQVWQEIRLPAFAEENDVLGRSIGVALCPERYDEEALSSIQCTIGTRAWNALYQQRPSAEEGNIFKRQWWRYYDECPDNFDQTVMSWDMAFKETTSSDFVVGQVWGKIGANKYLIDQVRARMDFPATLKSVRNLIEKYPWVRTRLIEDKANGSAIISMLQNEISGLIAVEPEGGKESRAHAFSVECESGNIYLPNPRNAPWVSDFIEEFANFPNGKHDDQVDAASQAMLRLRQSLPGFTPFTITRQTEDLRFW